MVLYHFIVHNPLNSTRGFEGALSTAQQYVGRNNNFDYFPKNQLITFMGCLHDETNMKLTYSARRARVYSIHLLHVCFIV